jgi:Kef-type K+ transport systems, membrane components
MIEGGYSDTAMGKTILGCVFYHRLRHSSRARGFVRKLQHVACRIRGRMCVVLWFMPTWTQFIIVRLGATRVSEPEVKFIFFILFFLGGLATTAKSEAVLPAYLVGLVLAGVFLRDKTLVNRMRSIAFAIFTPFYFIKAGLYVSLPALWAGLGIIGALLLLKMITKLVGVFPLARMHYMGKREASYTTLLMATGLTFGTISALFGLQNKNHRPAAIHNSCQCRDPERVCADPDRAKVFPAISRGDARVGTCLSHAHAGVKRRGRGRQRRCEK